MIEESDRTLYGDIPGFENVAVRIKVIPQEDHPNLWELRVLVTRNNLKFATARALIVKKDRLFGAFHRVMDIHSRDAQYFGIVIFDAQGKLRPWFTDNPIMRGSGVWGAELNQGALLYVEEISVEPQYRRRGIGTWLLNWILHCAEADYCNFAYVDGEGDPIAINMCKAAGFRHIGRTQFLGYSIKDPDHPSRSLPAAQDPNRLVLDNDQLDIEQVQALYPIHYGLFHQDEDDALALLETHLQADPQCAHQVDVHGSTLLHIAAATGKTEVIRRLIEAGAQADVMNHQGDTPLHVMNKEFLNTRDFLRAFNRFNEWPGRDLDEIEGVVLLKHAMGLPVGTEEQEQWGCTCAQCIGGIIPPRMKQQLIDWAETSCNNIRRDTASVSNYLSTNLEEVEFTLHEYIPPEIRTKVTRSYVTAFGELFQVVASLLQNNQLPSVEAIKTAIQQESGLYQHYFSCGGKIEHVLNALIHRTMELGPGGENKYCKLFGPLDELPTCGNDEEYCLLRGKLLLGPMYNGPYSDDDEGSDQDYSDEDESDYSSDGYDSMEGESAEPERDE